MKIQIIYILIGLVLVSNKIFTQKIELLGPPCGVNINSMKIHPQNDDYLYSTESANASFFRTTDGGLTVEWSNLLNQDSRLNYIECDYNNTDIFYCFKLVGGFLKTTDGGKSWNSILQCEQSWDGIEVNPLSTNSILATKDNEIWKSYDSGTNWFKLTTFNTYRLTQLEISHQDTSILYASGVNSLYKSTDDGLTWQITTTYTNGPVIECMRMEVLPTNDKLIYFILQNYYGGDLYRSIDGGDTTELLLESVTDFAVNPFSPEIIYATSEGSLFVSDDGGSSWNPYNDGFPFNDVYAGEIEISQQNPDILYVSTYYGIYKTTNGGESWFYTKSAYTNASRLVTFKNRPGSLLALTRRGDLMKTSDNGETWYNPEIDTVNNVGFDFFTIDPFNESTGYLANTSSLYKTTNYGDSWFNTGLLPGAVEVRYHQYLQNVVFGFLYGIKFGRSTNGGADWELFDDTSTVSIIFNQVNHSKLFSLDPYGIRQSTDLGSSWNIIKIADPHHIISAIAMPSNSEDIVYCGLTANSELPGHLFKSTDGGATWKEIDSALHRLEEYVSITSIAIDNDNPQRLFVGMRSHGYTEGGLYLTEDDGKSWTELFNSRVDFIQMYYGDPKYVYFGTKFGIMRMRDSALVAVNDYMANIPTEYLLAQNYPNPFNPSTIIDYQIQKEGLVTLKVYDILGNELETLVNEYQRTGKYSINFNASNLASGVYIYRLRAGDNVLSKKMILMK